MKNIVLVIRDEFSFQVLMQSAGRVHQDIVTLASMPKLPAFISLVVLLSTIFSCNPARNVSGTYVSKFAIMDFFGTTMKLNRDSSFSYRMSGDMQYDTGAGRYRVADRYITLVFHSIAGTWPHEPARYFAGHNKLFGIGKNGRKTVRAWGYSKRRKYILLGTHWWNRKYYLKKLKR